MRIQRLYVCPLSANLKPCPPRSFAVLWRKVVDCKGHRTRDTEDIKYMSMTCVIMQHNTSKTTQNMLFGELKYKACLSHFTLLFPT